MGDTRAHAPFAPSSSHRWLECPQSVVPPLPPEQTNPAAIEGTDAHWVGEQALTLGKLAQDFVGQVMPSGAKCTKGMANYVQNYVKYVRNHLMANGGRLYIEQRLEMSKVDPRFWGSADVVQLTKLGRLHVFDLKYGKILVEVDENTQLQSYALGALTKFRDFVDLSQPVTVHICQPRPRHPGGPNRLTKFSIDELIAFGKSARQAIRLADSKNPPYKEGEHCQFCRKEFICPKLNQFGRKVWT